VRLRHAAKGAEGMVVRVEQHLVRQQQIGANVEGLASYEPPVAWALIADGRPILGPVELERFARLED
jgi:hypothetical protein